MAIKQINCYQKQGVCNAEGYTRIKQYVVIKSLCAYKCQLLQANNGFLIYFNSW